LREVLLSGVEEEELVAALSPGDTVLDRARTVGTRAVWFDRATSTNKHEGINAAGDAFGVASVPISSPWFSPPLVKLLNLRSRVNRRLTLAIVHRGDTGKEGAEDGGGREEQVSEPTIATPCAFRQAEVGSPGLQDKSQSSRSSSIEEQNRYNLCIGTFGSIPVDCEFVRPGRERCYGSGSPSPGSEIHFTGIASTAAERGSHQCEFDMHKRDGYSEEKETETSSVSAFCRSSPSKQVDSRDVEANPRGLWSNQEGQKSCLSFNGSESSSIAVGEDSRGVSVSDLRQGSKVNESVDSVAAATATSNGRARSSSSSPSCTMVDEVECFFQQLWHIPWNLTKGCPRATSIKHPPAVVPRVPRLPPPLLPQERSGLCCLGVEEEGFTKEPVMAERGRGRGRGGAGRGDWQANQQQPPP
jgi:hypothetical protein